METYLYARPADKLSNNKETCKVWICENVVVWYRGVKVWWKNLLIKKKAGRGERVGVSVYVSYLESPLTWRVRISPYAFGLHAAPADTEPCVQSLS